MQRARHIGIDVLGILLIISAGLFGWLPGPGGIPLFLAGLGLLSVNHQWARRWLKWSKDRGTKLTSTVFIDHPGVALAYDLVSLAAIVLAVFILSTASHNLWRSFAVVLACFALGIFLGNRNRASKILSKNRKRNKI